MYLAPDTWAPVDPGYTAQLLLLLLLSDSIYHRLQYFTSFHHILALYSSIDSLEKFTSKNFTHLAMREEKM